MYVVSHDELAIVKLPSIFNTLVPPDKSEKYRMLVPVVPEYIHLKLPLML